MSDAARAKARQLLNLFPRVAGAGDYLPPFADQLESALDAFAAEQTVALRAALAREHGITHRIRQPKCGICALLAAAGQP